MVETINHNLIPEIESFIARFRTETDATRNSKKFLLFLTLGIGVQIYNLYITIIILIFNPNATPYAGFQTRKILGSIIGKQTERVIQILACMIRGETENEDRRYVRLKSVIVLDVKQTFGDEKPAWSGEPARSWNAEHNGEM